VALVSPHPLALEELRRLAHAPGIEATCNSFDAVAKDPTDALCAAVCVVDACVPAPARDALLALLLVEDAACRVLLLSDDFTDEDAIQLLQRGVKGLIRYEDVGEQLQRAIGLVADGAYWAPRGLISRVIDAMQSPQPSRVGEPRRALLSRRETEVLEALLDNLSNKEIAQRLHISERTVKFHVSNLLAKYGVTRRSDLIVQSLQKRFVTR
jgi:DNA-binding NarL/FixJ family response regulator